MSHPRLCDFKLEDRWAVARGDIAGKPMTMRVRSDIDSIVGHPELSDRLRIVWGYIAANASGMPSEGELTRMNECEDAIVRSLESENHAIITHSITCDGLRQWVFQTSNVEESAKRINQVLPHDPPCPIEISAEPDPEWAEYRSIIESMGGQE